MTSKSSKRSTGRGTAGGTAKQGRARPTAKANSAKPRRKRLPAWNEIEIDEQRENAGRPEPAFLRDGVYADDDLAEELGEEFVLTATSGEQSAEDLRNQDVPEEVGGPFVETSARTEFAYGSDPSNPQDAEPSPFPMAIKSLEEKEEKESPEDDQEERQS